MFRIRILSASGSIKSNQKANIIIFYGINRKSAAIWCSIKLCEFVSWIVVVRVARSISENNKKNERKKEKVLQKIKPEYLLGRQIEDRHHIIIKES